MSSEISPFFQTVPCSAYCLRVADGTHDSPKESQIGKLLVTSKNVKGGRLVMESAYLISDDDYTEINRRSKVDQWDLLLTMIGTVGEVCIVEQTEPSFAIKNVGLLKCGSEIRAKWLYYFLRSPQGQALIEQRKKGSTQQYISLTEIRNFPVSYPVDEQEMRAAVSLLSMLDGRINLLHETNATLEAIAQALFKSWFVDFDPVRAKMEGRMPEGMDEATAALFPDGFEETELGAVPRGWRTAQLADVVEAIFSGGTPNTRRPDFWGGDIPWFSSGETRNIIVTQTEKYITLSGIENSSTRAAKYGDILIASAGQGHTRGQTSYCTLECYINQSVVAVRAGERSRSSWLFFNLRRRYEEMRNLSDSHSSRGSLTTKLLAGMPMIIPTVAVMAAFDEIIAALIQLVASNEHRVVNLATLRDTLLPRLISGQLRLPDAQLQLETVDAI